jgi:hypothetical protein
VNKDSYSVDIILLNHETSQRGIGIQGDSKLFIAKEKRTNKAAQNPSM